MSKPTLEALEDRLALAGFFPTTDLSVAGTVNLDGPNYYHALVLPADGTLNLAAGASLNLLGGNSNLQGTVTFGDYHSLLNFIYGTVAIQGGSYGLSPDPFTPGNIYFDQGAQVAIAGATFAANVYNGYDPLGSAKNSNTLVTFQGTGSLFQGGGNPQYYNWGQTILNVPGPNASGFGNFVIEANTVTALAPGASLGMVVVAGNHALLDLKTSLSVTPAGTALPHEANINFQSVYLDGAILNTAAGAILTANPYTDQEGNAYVGGVFVAGPSALPIAFGASGIQHGL